MRFVVCKSKVLGKDIWLVQQSSDYRQLWVCQRLCIDEILSLSKRRVQRLGAEKYCKLRRANFTLNRTLYFQPEYIKNKFLFD